MGSLGFWLKVLGAALATLAFFQLGSEIETGSVADGWADAATMLVFAWAFAAVGNECQKRVPDATDADVADRPATRRFRPGRNETWLPNEVWPQFPDPLPDVPDVTGRPTVDVPEGAVPPDENLRRLWLVRAQLAAHLHPETAKARRGFGAGGVTATAIGLAFCALITLGSTTVPEEQMLVGGLLATAFMLVLFGRNLLAYTGKRDVVAKRRLALQQEEARLMALDALRPGGPIGGGAVGPGTPYVPPGLWEYRT